MIDLSKFDRIKTIGQSMFPFLQHGDVIYYRQILYEDIKTNDIIVVKSRKSYFTHRVIFKNDDYIVTKGDNNPFPDRKVMREQIVGKVYQIKRKGKVVRLVHLYLLQSILYFKEIKLINSFLRKNNFKFLFLKGLPLHLHYEKRHPQRIYADCDVFVDKSERNNIENIFYKLGYKKLTEKSMMSGISANPKPETNYYKVVNGVRVVFDVHFEPAFMMTKLYINHRFYDLKLFNSLTGHLLKSRREIKVNRNSFSILKSVELVAYLALHFFHHNYRGIYRLELIKEIIDKEFSSEKWRQLGKFILQYKLQNFVFPVFILLKDYYSVSVPRAFLSKISPKHLFNVFLMSRINSTVFTNQNRFQAGIERFLLLLTLSPQPLYQRLMVFTDFAVVLLALRLVYKYLLSRIKKIQLTGK